jgi:hypothetical protein
MEDLSKGDAATPPLQVGEGVMVDEALFKTDSRDSLLFKNMDKDGDGMLSKDELSEAMSSKIVRIAENHGLGSHGYIWEDPLEVESLAIKTRFFVLGLHVGSALQMFLMSVVAMGVISVSKQLDELANEFYPLFRGLFLVAFFWTIYGVDMYIWKHSGIDYWKCLGVSWHHSYHFIIRSSTGLMAIIFTFFVLYVLTLTNKLIPGSKVAWPLAAMLCSIIFFLWPLDWMSEWNGRAQRFTFLYTCAKVIVSPFSEPTFLNCFIADIWTSMPKIFSDLQYSACIYTTGAAFHFTDKELSEKKFAGFSVCSDSSITYQIMHISLSLLPFCIRLMQSLRSLFYSSADHRNLHAANALKYVFVLSVQALSFASAHHSGYHGAWVVMSIIATLFTFTWDVVMDWGLGDINASPGPLLRSELTYPTWCYYAAVCSNAVARTTWAIYISPKQTAVKEHTILLFGVIELLRRAQWALIRLEWKQIYDGELDEESAEVADAKTPLMPTTQKKDQISEP